MIYFYFVFFLGNSFFLEQKKLEKNNQYSLLSSFTNLSPILLLYLKSKQKLIRKHFLTSLNRL